ncbi:MAG: hypothetical protein K0S70_164 [Microbacterium sp.]|jgi:SOS response regulatory protein OraA/RecX|nr:hypothetical protein [Microbacterium sp.]
MDMVAARTSEGWFGQPTGLLDDVRIDPDDARVVRSRIRRKYSPAEAAFLLRQLGIEENT